MSARGLLQRNRAISQFIIAAIAAVASAWAAAAIVRYPTPIDDALPLICVVVTVVAMLTSPAVELSVPLLLGGEIVIADERMRLIWFGLTIGVAFAAALIARPPGSFLRASTIAVCAIVLLRWIPFPPAAAGREIILLVLAVAIVAAWRSTPAAVAIAVGTALFVNGVPLRTMWPALVVIVAGIGFTWFASRETDDVDGTEWADCTLARVVGGAGAAIMLLFFAWSGAFARAMPLAVRGLPRPTVRQPVGMALGPGQSVTIDVPPGAKSLIVSGANVSRLRSGTLLGRIDPGGSRIAIGDAADWGFLRREHFHGSRNPLPRDPAGLLRGYGYASWIDGAGRVAIPRATVLTVTADHALPAAARLQIDAFEMESR